MCPNTLVPPTQWDLPHLWVCNDVDSVWPWGTGTHTGSAQDETGYRFVAMTSLLPGLSGAAASRRGQAAEKEL
jgi:hypothetical protein